MKFSYQTKRYSLIVFAILCFLPPIALLPRFFGSMSICGSPFCMRMLLSIDGFTAMSKVLFVGLIMLICILLISFFAGRFFCSHICPVGGIAELGSKAVPRKIKINYSWISAPVVRYSYLLAFILIPVLGIGSICCSYCNFSIVSSLFGSITNPASRILLFTSNSIVNLVLLFLLGFFALGGRAYCNFLCPIGAIDALFNAMGSKVKFLKRIRIDQEKCNQCGQCVSDCPVWAIQADKNQTYKVNQISCIPCKICMQKCPEKAISYKKV